MSRWTCKWFFLSVILLALVVGGCGGNGGNGNQMTGNMDDDDDTPPMVTCSDNSTAASQEECDQRTAAAAAAAAAAVKRAETLAPVIARPNDNNTPNNPNDDFFDGVIDRNSPNCATVGSCGDRPLMVDGNMVSHTDTKKFTMSSDTPSALMGFAGSMHTRANRDAATAAMPRVTDEVTVYTNEEDATPTPFSKDGEVGIYTLNAGGADNSDTNPHTALTIASALNADVTAGKNGMTVETLVNISQHRPSAGTSTITFGKAEANAIKSLNGMFDMAPGMYECATTCMVTIDKDGKLTADIGGGAVTFVPASGAMVPVPDTDYLSFGYWVETSTTMAGKVTTEIAPFATGAMLYDGDDITAYESAAGITSDTTMSATYTGQAAGQFVHKTDVDGDSKGLVPTSSGAFTADANLTANFTNGTDPNIGTAFQDAIHGTISNFKNSSGDAIEGWELTLNPAQFSDISEGVFNGRTSGGKDAPTGDNRGGWRGSFYGSATDADGPIQPGSVAGEFLGHFANGHAVGAFGATKDKE